MTMKHTPIHPDTNGLPPAAGANDNGCPGGGTADTTRLVATKEVVAVIRGTLVRHGRRAHIEDDVPEVQTRAIEAARRGPMPGDAGEWKALVATIAERFAIDEKDKARTRAKYEDGLCEDPDSHGPIEHEGGRDPVDTKRYLAVLKELFDTGQMPARGGEILWGVAEELTQKEIAEETGLTERQVEYRLSRMREVFHRRIAQLGMLAMLVVLGAGFLSARPANSRAEHVMMLREAG
jgi:DNA-directed RNA polymerase specialized sigma24 family protein